VEEGLGYLQAAGNDTPEFLINQRERRAALGSGEKRIELLPFPVELLLACRWLDEFSMGQSIPQAVNKTARQVDKSNFQTLILAQRIDSSDSSATAELQKEPNLHSGNVLPTANTVNKAMAHRISSTVPPTNASRRLCFSESRPKLATSDT